MWEFNYGEWTEAYVFLRLLEKGRIYGADSDFQRDSNVYMDIINILRCEREHILKFERLIEEAKVNAYDNGELFRILPYTEVMTKADYLYNQIRSITTSARKFSIPEIEQYLSDLKFTQPKAPAMGRDEADRYGAKSDIIVTVEDSLDHCVSTLGFSIKSHLGQASTLFNSAKASNLKFRITGCNDDIMAHINSEEIDSEQGIFAFIKECEELNLEFECTSPQFEDNLDLIDDRMPELFANLMLIQLGYLGNASSRQTKDLVAQMAELNPLCVRRPDVWYESKIKQFLYASFAGLTASTRWDGRKRLSGGYIDVNKDGEMLYYRAVSDDIFESYLYEHTFFDRPSRGINKELARVKAMAYKEGRTATEAEINYAACGGEKTRKPIKGDWGYVYKDEDKYYINVNFQIRFK